MKKICFVFLLAVMTFLSCRKEIEKPTVLTKEIDKVTETGAVVRGGVSDDGGGEVTSRGFCYGETSNPTIDGGLTVGSGSGVGDFERTIENLKPNTAYYVRAYAINEAGVSYGDEKSFTTLKEKKLPVVTTKDVEEITTESAVGGGEVTDDGNCEVTARGVCWSTKQNPTTEDDKTVDGKGTGAFTSELEDLEPDTKYYVRAYATNEVGTSYGEEYSFTTEEDDTDDEGGNDEGGNDDGNTDDDSDIVEGPVTLSASADTILADGKDVIKFTASQNSADITSLVKFYVNDSLINGNEFTTTVAGAYSVIAKKNDTNVSNEVKFFAKAIGGNDGGDDDGDGGEVTVALPTLSTVAVADVTYNSAVSGGNVSDDGGSLVTARGVCWSTKQNPTTEDNKTTDGAGAGSFTSKLTNLEANTTYYVRAYATNEAGTAYGEELTFTTLEGIELPAVVTSDITEVTHNSAVSGGNVTDDGGAEVTARGVCWSTNQNPTIEDNKTTDGAGLGSYTSNLTNLESNTTYYVRAYATNEAGTAYGSIYVLETEKETTGTVNGHEWVDLGLPSGLKWATCNVGATKPEDYGNYYAWGETETKAEYTGSNSLTYELSILELQAQGIIDGNSNLTPSHDAAAANWGGSWRMPTREEMCELVDHCEWEWTTQIGVNGYKVTGTNGNSIFLPAAGDLFGSSLNFAGEYGDYWSSASNDSLDYDAYGIDVNSGGQDMSIDLRYYGFTVRPVTE